jgi:hypothetical protein
MGQWSSVTLTVKTCSPTSLDVVAQQNVPVGCCALVVEKVPVGIPLFQVKETLSPASGSFDKIVKQVSAQAGKVRV